MRAGAASRAQKRPGAAAAASRAEKRPAAAADGPPNKRGTLFAAFKKQTQKQDAAAAAAEEEENKAKAKEAEAKAEAELFDEAVEALVQRILRMECWSSVPGVVKVTKDRRLPFDDATTRALLEDRDKERLKHLQDAVDFQETMSSLYQGGHGKVGGGQHAKADEKKNVNLPEVCFCRSGDVATCKNLQGNKYQVSLDDLQRHSFYHSGGAVPLYDPESPCSQDPVVCGVPLASVVTQLGEKKANTCGWDVWELETTRGEVLKVREFKPVLPQLQAITGFENFKDVALHTFGIEEREYSMQLRTFELEEGQITLWVEEQEGGFDPLESLENVGGIQGLVKKHPKVRDLAVFQTASKDGEHRAVVNSLKETLWRLTSPEVLNLFGLLSFVEQFGLAPPPLAQAALQVFQERVNAADDFTRVDTTYVKAVHIRSIMKCPDSLKQDFLDRMWFRTPIVLERVDFVPSAPWCKHARPGTKCVSLH